jgi:cobalt/nickel transport system ATP-binding protein
MEKNPLIKLSSISFGYNGKPLLFDKLDFTVPEGSRIGLIGPNGCGKTTLFNIIMGFLRPQKGVIEIDGKRMEGEKDFQKARKIIGFLFQNSDDQLFCPSVREEVAFGPLNLRIPKPEVEKLVGEALEMVGLKGYEEHAPYLLSEGEKKRLAIASVIVMKPKVLLLDEPTNGLDESGITMVFRILKEFGSTYVVISQDNDFLKKAVEIVYTFKNGRLEKINKY